MVENEIWDVEDKDRAKSEMKDEADGSTKSRKKRHSGKR